jgi:predicted MPP superfamily phosphohydrolase
MKRFLRYGVLLIAGLLIATVISGQFAHQLQGIILPWTKTPGFKNDTFRFVVIGDLTGGEENGVFASAIEKINQLAPDFVISIGDLIEGYTMDQPTIDRYWQSFQKRISAMEAPFFYVPGNHDISNELLFENWKKLYKYDYYSFTIYEKYTGEP